MRDWVEIPVTARLLAELRPHVPQPVALASSVGGPYRKRRRVSSDVLKSSGGSGGSPSEAIVDGKLRWHAECLLNTFVACGWECTVDIGPTQTPSLTLVRKEANHTGKVVELVWPWEWTDAPEDDSNEEVAMLTSGLADPKRAIRLPCEWRDVAFETFVHGITSVCVYMSRSPRPRYADVDMDTLVSRVTDAQRHDLFARICTDHSIQLHGAVFEERAAKTLRFLCHAAMASCTRGGIARFLVSGDADTTHLRGFVTRDASVFRRGNISVEDAIRGGVLFEDPLPPPSVSIAYDFLINLSERNVCEELGIDVHDMRSRDFGAMPTATSLCWSYRLAFLRRVAATMQRDVWYLEVDTFHERRLVSAEALLVRAGGEREHRCIDHAWRPPVGSACVAWNGTRWALGARIHEEGMES